MHADRLSARVYDAGNTLNDQKLDEIQEILKTFGAVHVQRTGITSAAKMLEAMPSLGFGEQQQFRLGGRTSTAHQQKWVEPGLRRMDYYPPNLYLLPNNEVQYQRCSPRWVLFYCRRASATGGRTFVHSAEAVADGLRDAGALGRALLNKFAHHGLMIETGFLDADDPRKPQNYFQSWQERFQTQHPDEAQALAQSRATEYDACWWRDEDAQTPEGRPLRTLMTRITLTAFKTDPSDGKQYLRFPRIALDGPQAKNGYRRFPLGNNEPLSDDEISLLRTVYLQTRQGLFWRDGDLVLFDNMRFGHSREPFGGEREVLVGMAGELWDDAFPQPTPPPVHAPALICCAQNPYEGQEYYQIPARVVAPSLGFSARVFDADGALENHYSAILEQFRRYGALHIRNTGLRCEHGGALPDEVLGALGFLSHAFPWGGMSSGRTSRRALSHTLRATDDYPSHLWLLPHNEILYQRHMPTDLLFFSATDPTGDGGRTFVHSAALLEAWILAQGFTGRALINELRTHGLLIEMGFLDDNHPEKSQNYFRSWQERFQTTSRNEAFERCKASTLQFDECWWVEEPTSTPCYTLMTRIRIPAYYQDPQTGREHLFFPRIPLDGPAPQNGYRSYPLGNQRPLTPQELDLLLNAFLATREGIHWRAGDILLVDNIRYGHSREAFTGSRSIGVAMAGMFSTEHIQIPTKPPARTET